MRKKILSLTIGVLLLLHLNAQDLLLDKKESGAFALASPGSAASIYVDAHDHALVQKAAALLQQDIKKVTGQEPAIHHTLSGADNNVIIIGSLDGSPLIGQLLKNNKLKADSIQKWEAYQIQVIAKPFENIDKALVIMGSDRRGTAYGVFELSRQLGVSPWYWWADLPVKKRAEVYIRNTAFTTSAPKVKYRGIFINDEAPALSGWSKKTFGGFNHLFYEKVFELLLRMKGNYLWPAMWGSAFNDDDTLNPKMADEYGIVMGTSHHEPLVRAHDEWRRYGSGPWNYDSNETRLKEFWMQGIKRMGSRENIVTVGMRGDGDQPMTPGTATALLERIVKDQRKILEEATGKDASSIPQLWALYKEVQDYYDKGMRVPDDVTLLLCDDNWGNIRKLPKQDEKQRSGGYGIYYHYDYVGGPRNYKWINTNQIERTFEQMRLAYEWRADRIWIVNVGDIKPMEFPTEFFLDYAWNPKEWTAGRVSEYAQAWAARQFGQKYAKDIAAILTGYSKYNSRCKPELLSPQTYSLIHYREAETVVADYKHLLQTARNIYAEIPAEYKDAYYQLVLHPVEASANLNELYVTVAKNRWYAGQGRASANDMADSARALYARDSLITYYYNNILAGGKWNHMMDQTHIGYTYWQQPPNNSMPDVKNIKIPKTAQMGVSIEGSGSWWPDEKADAQLPEFSPYQKEAHYIDLFNRGSEPFEYNIETGNFCLTATPRTGRVDRQSRIWIDVNWQKAPAGKHRLAVTVKSAGSRPVVVYALINIPAASKQPESGGFVQANGVVSMEAVQYTNAIETEVKWEVIPHLGRTLSAVTTVPVTAAIQTPGGNSARLEYSMRLFDTGSIKVQAYFSPTLDFQNKGGLKYGVSFDNEQPQVINLHGGNADRLWNEWVANNIIISASQHSIHSPGQHILKFWVADPGVVLQKIVVDLGGVQPSYLGPPATRPAKNEGDRQVMR